MAKFTSVSGEIVSLAHLRIRNTVKHLKPVFHWNLPLRRLVFALPMRKKVHKQHEIYMKSKLNIHGQCQKTQRHLYSTDWRRALALVLTQILGLASGVWRWVTQIFTF